MKPLVTQTGEYDHDAIDDLIAANFTVRAKLGPALTLFDIEAATRDAWNRADAEMTRYNILFGRHVSLVAEAVARELATDGRLA